MGIIPAIISKSGSTGVASASTTYYVPLGMMGGRSHGGTTEADAQFKVTTARLVSGVRIKIYTNGTSGSTTIKTRLNGADGGLSVTVGAGATGFFDLTGTSDVLALNDLYGLQIAVAAGGTMVWTAIRTLVQIGECVTQFGNSDGVSATTGTAAGTYYLSVGGDGRKDTTEANVGLVPVGVAGTWRNLQIYVTANTWTGTVTFRNRINGADGTLVATVSAGSGATRVLDTTHSDTLTATDTIGYSMVLAAGSGQINYKFITSEFVPSGPPQIVVISGPIQESVAAGTKVWHALTVTSTIATDQAGPPTMTEQTMALGVPAIVNSRNCDVVTNAQTATTNHRFMVNEVASGAAISFGSGATGRFTDTTPITLLPTDVLNWEEQYTNGSQNVRYSNIAGAIITLPSFAIAQMATHHNRQRRAA